MPPTPLALALAACGLALPLQSASHSAPPHPNLLAIAQPPRTAHLIAITPSGDLEFQTEQGAPISLPPEQLVRWSTFAPSSAPDELLLADGSRLRLAAAWQRGLAWSLDAAGITARIHQLGAVTVPRQHLRALLLKLPPDPGQRQRIADQLLLRHAEDPSHDLLLLENGDSYAGTLASAGGESNVAVFRGDLGEVRIPLQRLRGVAFSTLVAGDLANPAGARPQLLASFRGGNLIAADSLAGVDSELLLRSATLGEQRLPLADMVALQGFGEPLAYLSDLQPVAYEHTPYLELPWPWRPDRNVLGGPLQASGRRYAKGLGLHTRSRLVYSLDGRFDRFAAAVALDDDAGHRGSAVFRVLTRGPAGWQEAFASATVRGGDPPQPVAVELAAAQELALQVDYADRGDELDYALWLDARLERTAAAGVP